MNSPRQAERTLSLSPFRELIFARVREFLREPEAVFWVYGFPILLTFALGIAFKEKPVEKFAVAVQQASGAERVKELLGQQGERFVVEVCDADECRRRLRTGKVALVVIPSADEAKYRYLFDPTHPESELAHRAVEDLLQRAEGRNDAFQSQADKFQEPGGRYIDFLVPGLLGMGLMGGGLWGVGFVTVDLRIKKLLKRFLATPMRKTDFLLAIMTSRLLFMIPEMLVQLLFAYLVFGVAVYGNFLSLLAIILLGAFTFSGLGLLIACRARTIETVSGLMNLVMLPMWVMSGIFFSPERFPALVQPFVQALPLTQLNTALRAIINDGLPLTTQLGPIAILAAWSVVSFAVALRYFRWQ